MTVAYVGLGANIGEPRGQLQKALQDLGALPQTRVTATSDFYRSAPMGFLDQPEFLNAVAQLDTGLSPEPLLDHLQEIEKRHGRQRSVANAPRTLDLDLLMYGNRVLHTPRLTLPHPRMHARAFVLQPLLELDSEISIPGKGKAIALLAACALQKIERVD